MQLCAKSQTLDFASQTHPRPFELRHHGGAAALRAAAEFSKEEAAKFKEGKTAVVKNSLNPRWDEACELVMPTAISTSGDARVELTMFDW